MAHEKRGTEYGVMHFLTEKSGTLSDVIHAQTKIALHEISSLSELGSIYLNDKRIVGLGSDILSPGQYVRVHTKPRRFEVDVDQIRILFQNDDFLVVHKPSGIPVHATVDNTRDNLIAFLQAQLDLKLYVTHRLDIATSGLIVLAKTAGFQTRFNSLLKLGKVEKEYRALVKSSGVPALLESGKTLIHYMEPSPRAPKTVCRIEEPGWQKCSLKILGISLLDEDIYELSIRLETGRTHQIRAQLGFEKWPIVGDLAYGSTVEPKKKNQIELVSYSLKFGDFHFTLDD